MNLYELSAAAGLFGLLVYVLCLFLSDAYQSFESIEAGREE